MKIKKGNNNVKQYAEKSSSSSSSFSMYMKEIKNYQVLSLEQQQQLGYKLKDLNNQFARNKLIQSNLKLVVKIACEFLGIGLSIQDLVQQGNLGLLRAIETYDVEKGVRFSTYASNWIKNYISRAINQKGHMIRIPIATQQKRRKIRKYIQEQQNNGVKVTDQMIKDKFILSDLQFKNGIKKTEYVVSMNTKYDDDDSHSLEFGDSFSKDTYNSSLDEIIQKQNYQSLYNAVEKLDEREKTIIKMRFGLSDGKIYTLKQVADVVGKTYERIRQLENQAVTHLNYYMKEELKK